MTAPAQQMVSLKEKTPEELQRVIKMYTDLGWRMSGPIQPEVRGIQRRYLATLVYDLTATASPLPPTLTLDPNAILSRLALAEERLRRLEEWVLRPADHAPVIR